MVAKKSGKKSSSKKAASKKTTRPQSSGKKGGGQRASSSKSGKGTTARGGKGGAKKASKSPAKRTTKKGTRTRTARAMVAPTGATRGVVARCLAFGQAAAIVRAAVIAVGGNGFDIDRTLEQMGVITENQCTVVTRRILDDVRSVPCNINDGAAACSPSTEARSLAESVADNASSPEE